MEEQICRKVDLSCAIFRTHPMPTDVALSDVEPFHWTKEVIDGNKKIIISEILSK